MRQPALALRSLAAATILSAASWIAPVHAADYTMKIGLGTMNDIQHQWANWMKEGIEARSKGRIEVKVFPRNQLGTIASQIEGLQLGTVEAFIAPADFFAGVDPRFGVFSIPLLFKNPAQAEKVLLDPETNEAIMGLGADKNLQVVSVTTYAFAHYFGKEPLRTLDDFKGKKLRVNATDAERAKMRAFGATAVPMDLGEVVPGLRQGVIDGTMSATAVYVIFKFYDIAKVLTEVDDTMIISTGAVSRPWLAKLPPDLRQIVIEEGAKLQPRTMARSRELDAGMRKKWAEVGGSFVKLPAADQAKVRSLLAHIGDDVTKGNPAVSGFYKQLKSTSAKY
ncbi:MAG: TRAP transporter substrate-binding protein [Betaproteobacteria bacterium]|jgi:TRAP-type C4-dicarboxylate transport system substrate-binding protein|nr:TRAP transporter substrate-binding protein [Betaproteobacteria bacterium]